MNWKSHLFVLLALSASLVARADAVWQWSVPLGSGRAFLWIPPECQQVRAVVVGQNNMLEEGMLQHPHFRKEMAKLGIAEIFIAPPFDTWQDATNNDAANETFNAMLKALATDSGYGELEFAPIIPIGHSAMASFPWNFAAWNPQRTLAILSVKGDAPQTKLTGNGRPNLDWGARNIDGIPGLMVMGEYEWWEDRLTPAGAFRAAHPNAPVAMLALPGRGHFDFHDALVDYLARFIRKAAEARWKRVDGFWDGWMNGGSNHPVSQQSNHPVLRPVDARAGWLVDRWRKNEKPHAAAAPFAKFVGDTNEAFWAFDREMARLTEKFNTSECCQQPQLLGFVQDGKVIPQTDTHNQVSLKFEPLADGVSFHLSATFLETVDGGSKNTTRWSGLPPGSPIGHAAGGGPVKIFGITGPVTKLDADTFCVRFNRVNATADKRNSDLWLLAEHPGDAKHKSIVQQALMKLPQFNDGAEQNITFPEIPDVKAGVKQLKLSATTDAGAPVHFYVREGPAEADGDTLRFTKIPPRSKFPLRVTVAAWQLGRSTEPQLKSAEPVERTFSIIK